MKSGGCGDKIIPAPVTASQTALPLAAFADTTYAVVDFETTGGAAGENRILEIGCVVARGYEITERYTRLVNPHAPVHPYVWTLTGISPLAVEEAPPLDAVLDEFMSHVQDRPLFAHNAGFDSSVLDAELKRRGRPELRTAGRHPVNPWICTVEWSKRLMPGLPKYKLALLCEQLGIELAQAHRGLDDALGAQAIVCELARRAEAKDWDLFALVEAFRRREMTPRKIADLWGK